VLQYKPLSPTLPRALKALLNEVVIEREGLLLKPMLSHDQKACTIHE